MFSCVVCVCIFALGLTPSFSDDASLLPLSFLHGAHTRGGEQRAEKNDVPWRMKIFHTRSKNYCGMLIYVILEMFCARRALILVVWYGTDSNPID